MRGVHASFIRCGVETGTGEGRELWLLLMARSRFWLGLGGGWGDLKLLFNIASFARG